MRSLTTVWLKVALSVKRKATSVFWGVRLTGTVTVGSGSLTVKFQSSATSSSKYSGTGTLMSAAV